MENLKKFCFYLFNIANQSLIMRYVAVYVNIVELIWI